MRNGVAAVFGSGKDAALAAGPHGTIEAVGVIEVLLIVLVGAVAVVVGLGWGDRMVSVPVDRAPAGLDPDVPVSAADIGDVRFNLAARGYRMAEVDRVLAQLAGVLAAKDSRIAELESAAAPAGTLGGVHAATISSPGSGTATLPAPGPDPAPPPRPLEPPGPAQPPMLTEPEPAAADTHSAPIR